MSAEPHVYEPPERAVQERLCLGHGRLPQALRRGRARPRGLLGAAGARADLLAHAVQERPRREQAAVLPLVRRRHPQRLLQLPRPERRGRTRRQDGDHLRGRRRRGHPGQLQGAARAHLQAGQCAQGARPRQGRPGRHLHADVDRGRGRDAGLRPDRRDPLGGVRRLLRAEPARPHRRHRRGAGDHRRRADARRQGAAAEGDRRRGADRPGACRCATSSSTDAPAARSTSSRRATSGCTSWSRRSRRAASRNGSAPSIRCSCSTPRARPASPRACSTRPAATCCMRR